MSEENPTDQEILAQLGVDAEEDLPETDEDQGGDDHDKKVRHAFAKKKRAVKSALELAEKFRKENEEMKEAQRATAATAPPPDTSGASPNNVTRALAHQAMLNLGISEINESNQELVRLEMQDIYSTAKRRMADIASAKASASDVINNTLAGLPLDVEGVKEVKKRLSDMDATQQADPEVVTKVASTYIGEKMLAGEWVPLSNGEEEEEGVQPSPDSSAVSSNGNGSPAATATAISAVKKGRKGMGVKPPKGKTDGKPKPPTLEETEEMRKMNFSDVEAYRAAKLRKSAYKDRV